MASPRVPAERGAGRAADVVEVVRPLRAAAAGSQGHGLPVQRDGRRRLLRLQKQLAEEVCRIAWGRN
eukprot:8613065-Pyramimonas_sp.AAC.1